MTNSTVFLQVNLPLQTYYVILILSRKHLTNGVNRHFECLVLSAASLNRLTILLCLKHYKYISYVRSCLDYCCSVWAPNLAIAKTALERVQKRFICILCFKKRYNLRSSGNYVNLCVDFNLPTLTTRRKMFDYICYCINS